MPFVSDGVAVREINPSEWRLLETVVYEGREQTFTVPVGFVTDFASVPKYLTWLVPPYGLYTKAAILHDYLLNAKAVSLSDADGIFRRAMRELGVSFLRRWMMWAAVRVHHKMAGATAVEWLQVVIIAIPSVLFLFIPAVVVLVFLALFWVLEYIVFAGIKVAPHKKQVNPPSFLLGADALQQGDKQNPVK